MVRNAPDPFGESWGDDGQRDNIGYVPAEDGRSVRESQIKTRTDKVKQPSIKRKTKKSAKRKKK